MTFRLALIPSATLVPAELQVEFGPIAPAMIPLKGRPLLAYLAEHYRAAGYSILVAGHQGLESIRHYAAFQTEFDISVVDVGATGSLAETVLAAVATLDQLPEHCIIHFADTLSEDFPDKPTSIFYDQPEDLLRWTTFSNNSSGNIEHITEKFVTRDEQTQRGAAAFVGVFAIADLASFAENVRASLPSGQAAEQQRVLDPFYQGLEDYYNALPVEERCCQRVSKYIDCGHLDTYYDAKRVLGSGARSFNQVDVDRHRGTIEKTSENTAKFRDEIRWYLNLPSDLRYMIPRIFSHEVETEPCRVSMEFYGYPSLNDLFLYGRQDMGVWVRVLAAVGRALDDLAEHPLHQESKLGIEPSLEAMYIDKTLYRLNAIRGQQHLEPFFQDELVINGQACRGIPHVLDSLRTLLEAAGVFEAPEFSIVHGDLCLSNILYDLRNSFIRVIDPRGRFGLFELHGDPRYDLAKLSHSFEGFYDFLVNGCFTLSWEAGHLHLAPHLAPRHRQIRGLFHEWLLRRAGKNYRAIKAIEALLFLSMVPLHADAPRSQEAFLGTGLLLYERLSQSLEQDRPFAAWEES